MAILFWRFFRGLMATIYDLPNKSISEMTRPELIDCLRAIRLSRRTPKKKPPKKKSKKVEKSPQQMVDVMTPELAAKLLEQLERR